MLTSASKGETVASLTGPTVGLLNSHYTASLHKKDYGTKLLALLRAEAFHFAVWSTVIDETKTRKPQ
jgi:hypothetical protein